MPDDDDLLPPAYTYSRTAVLVAVVALLIAGAWAAIHSGFAAETQAQIDAATAWAVSVWDSFWPW
jgi:hypothetical protein